MDDTPSSGRRHAAVLEFEPVERRPSRRHTARAAAVVGRDAALVWVAAGAAMLSSARGGDMVHLVANLLVGVAIAAIVAHFIGTPADSGGARMSSVVRHVVARVASYVACRPHCVALPLGSGRDTGPACGPTWYSCENVPNTTRWPF